MYNIYQNLKGYDCSTMVFDDSYITWQKNDFPVHDWMDFYPDVAKDIPTNAPSALGEMCSNQKFCRCKTYWQYINSSLSHWDSYLLEFCPNIWYSTVFST
jgi:hypothetical protein